MCFGGLENTGESSDDLSVGCDIEEVLVRLGRGEVIRVDSRPRAQGGSEAPAGVERSLHLCPTHTFLPHHRLQSTLIILTTSSIEE